MPDIISHASAYKRSNRTRSDERSSLRVAVQPTSIHPELQSQDKQGSRTRVAATSRHGPLLTSSSSLSPPATLSHFSSSGIGEYSGAATSSSQATQIAPLHQSPFSSDRAESASSTHPSLRSSAPPSRMPLRVLVPVVACAAFVGIMGAILATCHLRRRRRQRTRIALPLSPKEKPRQVVEDDDDDEPAIWDNRPPAASPLPPRRLVLGQDSGEYSPTATLFSPMSLTFPPSAMDKHQELKLVKSYDSRGWESPPPRSPPAIIVDRSSPTNTRVSMYSSDSFYSPSPSPIPSTDVGHSMRPFSPAMLDTFPAPPPLAMSAHRSISIPCLRSPPADISHSRMASDDSQLSPTSMHFVSLLAASEQASRGYMPTSPPTYTFPPHTPRRDHTASPNTSISSSSSSQSSSPRPRRKVVYGSPSRKQKSLQASRNSLELIRERGGA
ncbi:hypothetical protein AURDEDRAFT_115480 [Auricularia subglabra TFB-10046 SS5]|uniref:Uncharacterized protein n=1 Tax=Auricularia subglabra (strain TFB-10046 / SS5) TaxID=717982 RepID=J0LK92_AURST|nr:hypothetical protein AURDEDRAFT_115480 [Auricularia subglabra TFB-10046 SS5]